MQLNAYMRPRNRSAALDKAPERFRKPQNTDIRLRNRSAALYKAPEWFRKPWNAYIRQWNRSAALYKATERFRKPWNAYIMDILYCLLVSKIYNNFGFFLVKDMQNLSPQKEPFCFVGPSTPLTGAVPLDPACFRIEDPSWHRLFSMVYLTKPC